MMYHIVIASIASEQNRVTAAAQHFVAESASSMNADGGLMIVAYADGSLSKLRQLGFQSGAIASVN
jgi:16S rRNA G1207 methylase RsmC